MGFLDDFFKRIDKYIAPQKYVVDPSLPKLFTQEDIDDNISYNKKEIEFFIRNYIDKNKIIKISFDDKNNIKSNNITENKLNEWSDQAMRFICSNSSDYESLNIEDYESWYSSTVIPKKVKSSNDGKYSAVSYVGTEGLKAVETHMEYEYDDDGNCVDSWGDYQEEYYLEHLYNSFVLTDNLNSEVKKVLENTDVLDFCFSSDSKYLIIAKKDRSEDGYYAKNNKVDINIISLSNMETIGMIKLEKNEYCFGMSVNPHSTIIAIGTVEIDDLLVGSDYYEDEDENNNIISKEYLPKIKIYDMQTLRLKKEICLNDIISETKLSITEENFITDYNIGRFKFDYSYDENYIICSISLYNKLYIFNCKNNTLVTVIEDCLYYDICMSTNKIAICKDCEYYILDFEKNEEIRPDKCYRFYKIHTIKLNLSGTKLIIKDIKLPISSYYKCICVYNITNSNLVLDRIIVYDDSVDYYEDHFLEVTSSDELLFSCNNFIYKYDLCKNKFTYKIVKLFNFNSSYEYNKLSGYLYGKLDGSINKYTSYFNKESYCNRDELDYIYNEISRRVIGKINNELGSDDTVLVLNTKDKFLECIDEILNTVNQESSSRQDNISSYDRKTYSSDAWSQRDWNEYYSGDPDIYVDPSDYWGD